MAIITLPDLPIESANLKINYSSDKNTSPYTKDRQVYSWPGEAWFIQLQPAVQNKENASKWRNWIKKMKGHKNTFYTGDPMYDEPIGTASGTAQVDSITNDRQINLKNINGTLKAGDYIEISNSLYILEEDISGGSVTVSPRIRENYSNGTTVNLNNPQGEFRLTRSDLGWTDEGVINDPEPIEAREVIQ